MAKVGAKIGFTLKIFGDDSYQFIRPEISIEDIDTEQPLDQQLENAKFALTGTWDLVKDEAHKKIVAEMPNVDAEMELQISRKLQTMEKAIRKMADRIRTDAAESDKLKEEVRKLKVKE